MRHIIGCVGCGNMGSAIMTGFAKSLSSEDYHLCAYDHNASKLEKLKSLGIQAMSSIAETAANSDILIFAVKPQNMSEVLQEAQPEMKKNKTAISLAAGIGLSHLRLMLGDDCTIARCMPTTTARAGHGVFAICFDPIAIDTETQASIMKLFENLGMCLDLPEGRFASFSALIGAGPAYIFAFMHGLVQAGITLGFKIDESEKMFADLLAGCAVMARDSKTFMELRNEVCSPGGLTIAGINVLDRAGLTGLVVEAVEKAEKRGKDMED